MITTVGVTPIVDIGESAYTACPSGKTVCLNGIFEWNSKTPGFAGAGSGVKFAIVPSRATIFVRFHQRA